MSDRQTVQRVPKIVWQLLKLPVRALYAMGLGFIPGSLVLLLTTTGRKSGLARVTPLQFEEVEGDYYVASARGDRADWYRNLLINSNVKVQVRSRRFDALAGPITDAKQIADFLEIRLNRHPRMMAAIFRAQGYPSHPTRSQLEAYAAGRAMAILKPLEGD